MRVPLRSRSNGRRVRRGLLSLRRGRERASELLDDATPALGRGRERAEELAREAAERVPSRRRRRQRRRGMLAVVVLALIAGVALYLAWQRRDQEPARLTMDPPGPDVAPPPAPEPPAEPVAEATEEQIDAVSEVTGAAEASPPDEAAAETEPARVPAPALAIDVPVEDPAAAVESVEADEASGFPGADVATSDVDEPAQSTAMSSSSAPLEATETGEADEVATEEAAGEPSVATERPRTWFDAAVNEAPQPEAPEPAPDAERSMPLRGASSLPPSSPAGAPFRAAGDQLPNGRSWPTLP